LGGVAQINGIKTYALLLLHQQESYGIIAKRALQRVQGKSVNVKIPHIMTFLKSRYGVGADLAAEGGYLEGR